MLFFTIEALIWSDLRWCHGNPSWSCHQA